MTPASSHLPLDEGHLVLYEITGRVATLTLNRPEKLNTLTPELLTQLLSALDRAQADEQVRVVRLREAGRFFRAGYDLAFSAAAMQTVEHDGIWDPMADYALISGYVDTYMRLWRSPKHVEKTMLCAWHRTGS
jgi:enoyl-CoA hydratase